MQRVLCVLLLAAAAMPSLAAPPARHLVDAVTAAARVAVERPAQAARAAASRAVARAPAWHWAGDLEQALQRGIPGHPPGHGVGTLRHDGRAVAANLRDLHALITRGAILEGIHRH